MNSNARQIKQCLLEIESNLSWGSSNDWTHRDFLNLSDRIFEVTGEQLSYITLKRIWGKVSYSSYPNDNTLNILAKFIGYGSWREYINELSERQSTLNKHSILVDISNHQWISRKSIAGMVLLTMLAVVVILSATNRTNINPDKYSFSSHKVVSNGIPNSVVFDIDAVHSPFDSVEVQQSWDESLRTRIPKDRRQHTSIYYYPGFFEAKLVVGGEIVREHSLHITTNGWYCAIQQDPVPVYFPATDLIGDGFFELKLDQVRNMNINMHPNPPIVRMGYFADFEVLKTDNFIFETKFRNTFHEGSAACQHTRIYLLCEGSIIKIPLMAKGCSSSATLSFVNHYVYGKESDLSGFGVDFQEDVKVRIESKGGTATVLINDQLVYPVPEKIAGIEIKGIDFRFEGLGKIDYVKLGNLNGDWILNENF